MEPIFEREFALEDIHVDRYGRMKPSAILYLAQEVAGMHCAALSLGAEFMSQRGLFWAVTRHKVQIQRLPTLGEKLRVETWPMPATRVAYPRSMVAYDEQGQECFRSVSIWVLMDTDTRRMILPGMSGISVPGTLRGGELPSPNGLILHNMGSRRNRQVSFTDLDRNGHMNNTRCLDWIYDLLPSAFHANHSIKGFTVCYLSEALEGQELSLSWDLDAQGTLVVDAQRVSEKDPHRVFSAKLEYTSSI